MNTKAATAIKKKGMAGLFYAYDSNGNYVSAKHAIKGERYRCPYCQCEMYATTIKGTRIFARMPNTKHESNACKTIERTRLERSFANLDPISFIGSLCHASPKTKDIHNNATAKDISAIPYKCAEGNDPILPLDDDNILTTENTKSESVDSDAKLMPFQSLRQIAESGIRYLNPNDKQGEYYVSDFIMTYKYAKDFFKRPNFNLGARIVYARSAWHANNSIYFKMFSRLNDFSVLFQVYFPRTKQYNDYKSKFLTVGKMGKTTFHKEVLIACDNWNNLTSQCKQFCYYAHSEKGCPKNCLGMYQATFTCAKQIYILPDNLTSNDC